MSINHETVFDAEEIRDVNTHISTKVFNGNAVIKSFIIENDHNQIATFQCKGSAHADFAHPFQIGDAFDISANTDILCTCDNYIPYWWIEVTYDTAPTTGDLSVHILGVEG